MNDLDFNQGQAPQPEQPIKPRDLSVRFHGNTGDYFKIWMVNVLLSVVTLGVYTPWAKVRTKRYFYGNTELDGHTFDYTADPISILKGRLLMFFILIMFYGGMYYSISQGSAVGIGVFGIVMLMIMGLTPWAIVKGMSFNMRNTTYRSARFGFMGEVGQLMSIYLIGALLQAITLGLYAPIFIREILTFKFDHATFGSERFSFQQRPGFYGIYAYPALLYFVTVLVAGIAAATLFGDDPAMLEMVSSVLIYPILAIVTGLIRGGTFKYVVESLSLEQATFSTSLKKGEFASLYFTNLLAIVFSFGLATPWAMIRTYKYKAESLSVTLNNPALLSKISHVSQDEGSALADAAVDMVDIDFGI